MSARWTMRRAMPGDMIDKLSITYNRQRQAQITKELIADHFGGRRGALERSPPRARSRNKEKRLETMAKAATPKAPARGQEAGPRRRLRPRPPSPRRRRPPRLVPPAKIRPGHRRRRRTSRSEDVLPPILNALET